MIAWSAPAGFQSVAVKLRRLLDPEIGMESTDNDKRDLPSLRQVLAFVESAGAVA